MVAADQVLVFYAPVIKPFDYVIIILLHYHNKYSLCIIYYSGKCHRCKDANNCATSIETQSVENHYARQSTDDEDLDAIYSLVNYTDQNPDREKLGCQNSKLGLDKYYEGEQHQIGRHVIVIVSQVLLMIVVSVLHTMEFKLHVSGNGKRQVRTFLTKLSMNVSVSYFFSCVERLIIYFSFKTASSFTLYCLIQ